MENGLVFSQCVTVQMSVRPQDSRAHLGAAAELSTSRSEGWRERRPGARTPTIEPDASQAAELQRRKKNPLRTAEGSNITVSGFYASGSIIP